MRSVFAAVLVAVASVLMISLAAQEDHPPASGCALPKINEMARSVFGPYAAVYHTGGLVPGDQSANGKVRIFAQGVVSCMFFRSAPPPRSEALFAILHSYENPEDAATAFKHGMNPAMAKTVHQDGKVEFANSPGKAVAHYDTLLAEVRWATSQGRDNTSVSGATLEPIARQLLIPK